MAVRALILCSLLAYVCGSMAAQEVPEPLAIPNWPAPPFWSPPGGLRAARAEVDVRSESGEVHPLQVEANLTAPLPFIAVTPCRQYNSLQSTPLAQGVNRTVTLTGAPCGIPVGAGAVSANITVFNITGATGNGVFKVDIVSPPAVAWINYPQTEAQRANAGVVALNGSGQIVVQVAQGGGQVDFVVDVNGYYAGSVVTSLTPGTGLSGNATTGDVTLGIANSGVDTLQLASGAVTPAKLNATVFAGSGVAGTAARSDHDHDASYWKLTGNAGTAPGTQFLGTTDNQALELKVSGARVLRLEPASTPNLVGGYSGNTVTPGVIGATIGGGGTGGFANQVATSYGTIGGGFGNIVGGASFNTNNTIGGGRQNTASGNNSTVAGGFANTSSGGGSTVAGGEGNMATDGDSTVGGGSNNVSSGANSTVPGGSDNAASGNDSFAAGFRAKATNLGSFVWSDFSLFNFSSTADNQFSARAQGGVRFVTAIDGSGNPSAGVAVAAGGNAWAPLSDVHSKDNFAPVDGRDLVEHLAAIPIQTWNYKTQDRSIRHIGPVAQDFYAAFCVGEDDKHITTIDADGVALAAIQGLYRMVREKEAQIAQLRKEKDEQITLLEARLAAIEERIGEGK